MDYFEVVLALFVLFLSALAACSVFLVSTLGREISQGGLVIECIKVVGENDGSASITLRVRNAEQGNTIATCTYGGERQPRPSSRVFRPIARSRHTGYVPPARRTPEGGETPPPSYSAAMADHGN